MRKFIIGVIIGAIIFGSIGVYAGTKLKAEDVSYNGGNVKEAIDELYTKTKTSDNCVQGWHQLKPNENVIGDQILDFAPSVFYISYYDKSLPAGGATGNGLTVYYNKAYSEDTVYWTNILIPKTTGIVCPLSDAFIIDNNLIYKNFPTNAWNDITIFYMACK